MEQYKLTRTKYWSNNKIPNSNWSKGSFLVVSIKNRQFKSKDSLIQIFNTFKNNVGNGSFNIVVGDYLDRYNEIIFNDYKEAEAIEISLKKGDAIINRMKEVLKELNIHNYTFIRTEEFHQKNNYSKFFNKYKNIYRQNLSFKKIVDETVEQFFGRMKFNNNSTYKFQLGTDYLIEELAIFEILINEGNNINVYPGKHLQVLKDIVRSKIQVSGKLKDYILVQLIFIKSK